MSTETKSEIKDVVREKYGQAALRVGHGGSSCCGATPSSGGCDPITTNLYDGAQAAQIPAEALLASLGCGNPTALAQLSPGEIVLDLVLVAASTCFSPHDALDPQAKLMGST